MTKKEKFEHLKEFLQEQKISFLENCKTRLGVIMDLEVVKFRIAVHVSDETDDDFFKNTRRRYKPFFIREEESMEFIIEKMQNCICDVMMQRQKNFERKNAKADEKKEPEAEAPKRKRQRIVRYEKVGR